MKRSIVLLIILCAAGCSTSGNKKMCADCRNPGAECDPGSICEQNEFGVFQCIRVDNSDQPDMNVPGAVSGSLLFEPSEFTYGNISPNETAERTVKVTNVNSTSIEIESLSLDIMGGIQPFELRFNRDQALMAQLIEVDAEGSLLFGDLPREDRILAPGDFMYFTLSFTSTGGPTPTGHLVVGSRAVDGQEPVLRGVHRVPIVAHTDGGEIQVSPTSWSAGRVLEGETSEQDFQVSNVGLFPLDILSIELHGSELFVPLIGDADMRMDARSLNGQMIRRLEPNEVMVVSVTYTADTVSADYGKMTITSNDPVTPEVEIELMANTDLPCLDVNPFSVEFESTPLNQRDSSELNLESCGAAPLTINRLYLSEDSDPVFELSEVQGLPITLRGIQNNEAPRPSLPLTIRFSPLEEGVYSGTLMIESDSIGGDPVHEVQLLGRGVHNDSP